jgi:DNA-binding winged helix-turn-helix (wHTH) protein/predicted Zn-dependent protease
LLRGKGFYQFGRFRLEPDERRVVRDGEELPLTGKPFDVLLLLVRRHGSLVRRDQIIKELWPETFVEPGNVNVHITKIRKVLGEECIEAVAGHGYRFTPAVLEVPEGPEAAGLRRKRLGLLLIGAATILALIGGSYLVIRQRQAETQARHPAAALYERALAYERTGDDEQARTTLDQALSVDPNYYDACVRAAYLSYELEEIARAGEYLARCRAESQARDEALRLKAQALGHLVRDNSNAAIQLLQLLKDKYPHDTDGLYRFAELATDMDRIDEADRATQACIALEPNNPYCRFQLTYIRIKQNRFDDVLADYNSLPNAIRDYPWFDEPLGIALFGKGELQQAGEAFDRLSKHQPRLHGTAHFTTGKEWGADVLLFQGRVDGASRRIQQLMETADNASARGSYAAYLAEIYALIGNVQQARKFANLTATASSDASDLARAAIVLASIDDPVGTDRVLKIRLQVTQSDLSPKSDHLIRGLLALGKGDKTSGIEELRLAYELNSRDELVAYWLGIAYTHVGDYNSALAMFKAVLDLKGTILLDDVPLLLPLATHHIGECYERLADHRTAEGYRAEVRKMLANADASVRDLLPGN